MPKKSVKKNISAEDQLNQSEDQELDALFVPPAEEQPEVPELSDEDEILAGQPEDAAIGHEPEPLKMTPEQIAQMQTAALLKLAESVGVMVANQQATRQIPYNEIKPTTPWNPEGKRDRKKLQRMVFQHGRPALSINMSEKEIELANSLKPGRYGPGRKIEVSRDGAGHINITYPYGKVIDRMEFNRQYSSFIALCEAIVKERKEKEEKRRSGWFDPEEEL